ncbi:hypothetical protein G7L40_20880 [Paenibacillus polymyxa]|uniref:Uncharacterized protein n=1 Tax=Paenibacillus polymyxa TaxID=1406 RepID=A0A378Y1G6_PAEPO|nr:hypothetical protein [Paenibacillus polymyxa]MBG9765989.1 hypothetical protein [Paenibacillus polymyxa]MCC3256588.1 hypothetical protein [Paenibacillus polymyxa]QPK54924.1 hypothetical protein G7035_20930 [Paenibacillus polymyxa]QPK60013.1 hypothetical protein G7L40_20880 [Paenibacillus polymyxa]UOD84396.1 hypothetical protein CUU60_03970 [Paenibacillus polymyxa ATCC 842]
MANNLDRFESPYHEFRFPDAQNEEVNKFLTCAGCNEDILVGEEILILFDSLSVHDDYDCLKKANGAKRILAGEEW